MAKQTEGLLFGGLLLGAVFGLAYLAAPKRLQNERELHAYMSARLRHVATRLNAPVPALEANYGVHAIQAGNGRISYNPRWIDTKLRQYCDNQACALGIVSGLLAHEMSHLIHGDRYTASADFNHAFELRADRFAGWMLAVLGHGVDDLERLWREFEAIGSPTHPSAAHRLAAINQGAVWAHNGLFPV